MNCKLWTVNCINETAREQVAELIGAHSMDIIFTSCASESNNAARSTGILPVKISRMNPRPRQPCYKKRHIVTSSVDHSSVLNYCMALGSGEFTSPRGFMCGP